MKGVHFFGTMFFVFFGIKLFAQEFPLELRPERYEKYSYKSVLEMHATVERRHTGQAPTQSFSSFSSDFGVVPTEQKRENWLMDFEIDDIYFLLESPHHQTLSYHMQKPIRNEYMDKVHAEMKKNFLNPITLKVSRSNDLSGQPFFSKVDSILDIPQLSNLRVLFDGFFIPFSQEKDWEKGWYTEKEVETDFGRLLLGFDIQKALSTSSLKNNVVALSIQGKITPLSPSLKLDGGFRGKWKVDRATGMTLEIKISHNVIYQYPSVTIYHQSTLLIQREDWKSDE